MLRGTVKWFNPTKGYGFIQAPDDPEDIFVHAKAVRGLGFNEGLQQGESVEFEVRRSPKGLQAVNVQRTTGAR